jgi:hypothetical protein
VHDHQNTEHIFLSFFALLLDMSVPSPPSSSVTLTDEAICKEYLVSGVCIDCLLFDTGVLKSAKHRNPCSKIHDDLMRANYHADSKNNALRYPWERIFYERVVELITAANVKARNARGRLKQGHITGTVCDVCGWFGSVEEYESHSETRIHTAYLKMRDVWNSRKLEREARRLELEGSAANAADTSTKEKEELPPKQLSLSDFTQLPHKRLEEDTRQSDVIPRPLQKRLCTTSDMTTSSSSSFSSSSSAIVENDANSFWISNLTTDFTVTELADKFSHFSGFVEARIAKVTVPGPNNDMTGCACVWFSNASTASTALAHADGIYLKFKEISASVTPPLAFLQKQDLVASCPAAPAIPKKILVC